MRSAACATSTSRLFAAALRRSSYPTLPACTPLLRAPKGRSALTAQRDEPLLGRHSDSLNGASMTCCPDPTAPAPTPTPADHRAARAQGTAPGSRPAMYRARSAALSQ
ncbi:hypothetical protein NDU88_004323 [Pleurodeles waltl]|uniref:Uncharacterized protein n=1 Tax=Pleurodeles waltl TaxID=8319 RepID=A0AAV7VKD7_PLEWA|nr:hypothetical protein NDU88_004323 [Pleurodeles waltl]